jgi:4-amino-4-deoxy-L-arabinose transferase-like glycosyltransferase
MTKRTGFTGNVSRTLHRFDKAIAQPRLVAVLIMALAVSTHMIYFSLSKAAWDSKPLVGLFNDTAMVLLDSHGTALWTPSNAQGSHNIAYLPPAYTFFLAATYLLFGHSWGAIAFTQSVVCGLVSILLYWIGTRLFSHRAGFLAALWALFYPYLFSQGGPNLYETMFFTFFLLVAVWGLLRSQASSSPGHAMLAGLFLGLAALCRPNALFVVPFVMVWLVLACAGPLRKRVRLAVVLCVIFLATIIPWTLRNWLVQGVFSPFGSFADQNQYKAYHPMLLAYYLGAGPFADPQLRSLSSDQVYGQGPLWDAAQTQGMTAEEAQAWRRSMPWSYWREHPTLFVELTILKVINLWSWILEPRTLSWRKQALYAISYVPILFLGIAGFWLRRDRWRWTSLFLALFLSFTIFAAITYGVSRYRVPLDVFLILMASAAIEYIVTHLSFII